MNLSPNRSTRKSSYFSQQLLITPSQGPTECPICLQPVKVRGKISCCKHIFCYVCIYEWSKITNSCPLCKEPFHDIEKCDIDGNMCKGEKKRNIIHVEDKQQENDVLVQEFIYDDCPFLNEYVQDDFLVSDDAPILYETQMTATSSLVNLQHYETMSRSSTLSLDLESDSSPPRRRYSRRQRNRTSPQEIERHQREEEIRSVAALRRRRRVVIPSDNEDLIEDSDDNQSGLISSGSLLDSSRNMESLSHRELVNPRIPIHSSSIESPQRELVNSRTPPSARNIESLSQRELVIPKTPIHSLLIESPQRELVIPKTPIHSSLIESPQRELVIPRTPPSARNTNNSTIAPYRNDQLEDALIPPTQTLSNDLSLLPSEASAGATPILFSRTNTMDICKDSYEDPLGSRNVFQHFSKYFLNPFPSRRCYSDSLIDGHHIIPETPLREKRCRSESDRFLRDKLSHMI